MNIVIQCILLKQLKNEEEGGFIGVDELSTCFYAEPRERERERERESEVRTDHK